METSSLSQKRKSDALGSGDKSKKAKYSHQHKDGYGLKANTIQPGDTGIWVTCAKGKEGKSVMDLRVLFDEFAEEVYKIGRNDANASVDSQEDELRAEEVNEVSEVDIEASISAELASLKQTAKHKSSQSGSALFTPIKLNTPCLLFFRTKSPIEPVTFSQHIAQAFTEGRLKGCRYIKRLTPATLIGRANITSLEELAAVVLPPIYQAEPESDTPEKVVKYTYAIRPTIRNNNTMSRDEIIRLIARKIGTRHTVDLKQPQTVILVDVYQSVVSLSVIRNGADFDRLKRYTLAT